MDDEREPSVAAIAPPIVIGATDPVLRCLAGSVELLSLVGM